jgi:DNA-binding CsgD family transcriptional regulator
LCSDMPRVFRDEPAPREPFLSPRSPRRSRGARPGQAIAAAFATLTERESEVLLWILHGKRDGEIAILLDISPATASTHVRNLLAKLGVESRLAADMEVVRVVICGKRAEQM